MPSTNSSAARVVCKRRVLCWVEMALFKNSTLAVTSIEVAIGCDGARIVPNLRQYILVDIFGRQQTDHSLFLSNLWVVSADKCFFDVVFEAHPADHPGNPPVGTFLSTVTD